ncbi:MarR family transcriptional regulator [Halorubrum ejinorense]|uniref:MarR family transcriptional regulator n=1 Tax=Halorubrum ejinorense TaxID=425309 RepID=A0AAV3SRY4_9EURY
MATSVTGVLTPADLNDTDNAVLDVLRGGRVTPQYAAEELDVSRTYASERLKRLVEHGHVEKVAPGLYELVEDPRDIEGAREMISGIEKEVKKAEQGSADRDVENLRDLKQRIESELERRLDEIDEGNDA